MKSTLLKYVYLIFIVIVLLFLDRPSLAVDIRAFSLREAERLLEQGLTTDDQLKTLGGITRFAGMVFDRKTKDIILIGRVRDDLPPANIDDLVVALRSKLLIGQYPRVSIDRVEHTAKTGMQDVRFDGGLERTKFGVDFLESDVLLKRYSLDLLSQIENLTPYLELYEASVKEKLLEQGKVVDQVNWLTEEESKKAIEKNIGKPVSESSTVQSRFWYHVRDDQSFIVEKDDVYVIEELCLGVKVETIFGQTVDSADKQTKQPRDEIGEEFARQFTDSFKEVTAQYPILKRLKFLFDLVCIAEGIAHMDKERPELEYLLHKHRIREEKTPGQYRLVQRLGEFRSKDGVTALVQLSGGIDMEAILLALEDGDVKALKMAVLNTRPGQHALTWSVPLDDWEMPNDEPQEKRSSKTSDAVAKSIKPKKLGFGISVQRFILDSELPSTSNRRFEGFISPPPMNYSPSPIPKYRKLDRMLSPQERYSPRIGGVILHDVAKIVNESNGGLDLAGGNFSLILKGLGRGELPADFGKFITAVWAVYYSKEAPGISIDPIAWGVDKQLVRYIGRVVNTDLGRVMRVADYTMKKWAVGTEKPDIPGFRDVDEIAGMRLMSFADACRRFWFVPENMTFKASDNILLFESGRMTLKTEFMLGSKSTGLLASDQEFANFFTDHYDEIRRKYPIYEELFEYAKLVSLAKYLKEKGIPLQWFLLAHLDQVLTEDSEGTVETLSKGSQFLEGVRIEGGVEMPGRYVLDQSVASAISDAIAKTALQQAPRTTTGDLTYSPNISSHHSFEFKKQSYSVIPQHSLSSGRDMRGVRYETDIAVRNGDQPGLELVRYFRLMTEEDQDKGEFGKGWHLLIPYRVFPVGSPEIPFLNILIPEEMVVRNLLTGKDEILTWDDKTYGLAGYRPADSSESRIIGLFWTVAGGLRLVDKVGNEFWFNEGLMLSEMHLAEDYGVRFEYDFEEVGREAYKELPYRLKTHGTEIVKEYILIDENGQQEPLHRQLLLTDSQGMNNKIFTFCENNAGPMGYKYEAESPLESKFIAILTDGRHILIDMKGNEIWFNQRLNFEKRRSLLVKGIHQGTYRWNEDKQNFEFFTNNSVMFDHVFGSGSFHIASAKLFEKGLNTPIHEVTYQYTEDCHLSDIKLVRY